MMLKFNKNIIQEGPISHEKILEVYEFNRDPEIGANSTFTGIVRADLKDSKTVAAIEYSAYVPMVEEEFKKILQFIQAKYEDLKEITVFHSTGRVLCGQCSLFVHAASSHRMQAFKAVEEVVSLIKSNLPIWKKEIFTDGSYEWI